ncbi:MAG: transposase [Bacteroidota bacterium]
MDKFRNKYRIKSYRMPQWDYSGNGMYFITLVTQNRECNLGEIVNGEMILSAFGKIVNDEWLKSFEIRNELFFDEYIIMPNHVHAIVILDKNGIEKNEMNGSHGSHVETHGRASLQSPQSQIELYKKPFVRKPKSISSFMAGFKSAVNSKIDDYIDECNLDMQKYNRNNHFFQSNYHDHIIRNNAEYERIKKYIINNPLKWGADKFNPDKTDKE